MWEMTSICVKCLKYVRNNVRICEITYVYRKKTDICDALPRKVQKVTCSERRYTP